MKLSIGEAARRSGCSVATIRYYEEIGLIARAPRGVSGRRVYSMPDVERLRLIRRLRSMAFGLDAVRAFLAAMSAAPPACLDVRDLARAHIDILRARRAELDALERTLAGIASTCTDACTNGPVPGCTIIPDLARPGA